MTATITEKTTTTVTNGGTFSTDTIIKNRSMDSMRRSTRESTRSHMSVEHRQHEENDKYDDEGYADSDRTPKVRNGTQMHHFFTDFTFGKALLYIGCMIFVLCCMFASVAELFLTLPCVGGTPPIDQDNEADPHPYTSLPPIIKYPNPAYDSRRDHCEHVRYVQLFMMNKEECSFGRRLVMAILMGGLIGWERRQADRPAGIRTMSLVSLGSCLFTINSAFAFTSGPMAWDASRISAAIPSGVGFLGAGLIFKKTEEDDTMVVHGLTTAASVWLSAAVGIACGGELYFAGFFGTCLMMLLLRFGPRGSDALDDDDDHDDEDFGEDDDMVEEQFDHRPDEEAVASPTKCRRGTVIVGGSIGIANHPVALGPSNERKKKQPISPLPPPSVPPAPQLIFRDNPSQLVIPSLQTTTRSIGEGSVFTVTGESIENDTASSVTTLGTTTERTPMIRNSGKSTSAEEQRLMSLAYHKISSTKNNSIRSSSSRSSLRARNKTKKNRSRSNLGSIV